MNVRSALAYVPYFRNRLFVVHICEKLLREDALVDALLDVNALHEIGVRLVLVVEGASCEQLAARAGECEMQAAVAEVTRKLGDSGRILVRESGTEPVIRVMVEAATQEECQKYVDDVVDVICAKGHARV